MARAAPMAMCPMAEVCKGMMERPFFRLLMLVPGMTFIILAAVIIIWPDVLPWLVAAACIVAGGAMLVMARFMHRVGGRISRTQG